MPMHQAKMFTSKPDQGTKIISVDAGLRTGALSEREELQEAGPIKWQSPQVIKMMPKKMFYWEQKMRNSSRAFNSQAKSLSASCGGAVAEVLKEMFSVLSSAQKHCEARPSTIQNLTTYLYLQNISRLVTTSIIMFCSFVRTSVILLGQKRSNYSMSWSRSVRYSSSWTKQPAALHNSMHLFHADFRLCVT